MLILAFHLHFFHHVRGAAVDYLGVALAAFASWAGLPGPGESVLIATGVLAGKHHLDITPVLFWATAGATLGGVVGWVAGRKGGRAVLTRPGPLFSLRRGAAARGDEVFHRVEVIAILLAPSWVAGIHKSRARLYLPINFVSALAWSLVFGLGAYYAGPPILELAADWGTVGIVALVALVAAGVGLEITRRVRRHRSSPSEKDQAPASADAPAGVPGAPPTT